MEGPAPHPTLRRPARTSAARGLGGAAGSTKKDENVVGVAGQNRVVVVGEESDVRVDDIGGRGGGAQLPYRSGVARVEGRFSGAGQESGEEGLAGAIPPGLGDTPRGGDHSVFAAAARFDEGGDLPVAPFEGDEGPRIEDEAHSGGAPPAASGPRAGGRSAEELVRLGHLGVREGAELLLPGGHRFAEGLETQPVAGRFGQPRRHALITSTGRRPDGLAQLEVERDTHFFDTHEFNHTIGVPTAVGTSGGDFQRGDQEALIGVVRWPARMVAVTSLADGHRSASSNGAARRQRSAEAPGLTR